MATMYNNELFGGLWITRQELKKPNAEHVGKLKQSDPFAPPVKLRIGNLAYAV